MAGGVRVRGVPIRTITLGLAEPHPIPPGVIESATRLLRRFEGAYREAGYEVQTARLSTRSVFEDLAGWAPSAMMGYAQQLQGVLDGLGVEFCSLGTAPAYARDFPLDLVDVIPLLLVGQPSLNATVQVAWPGMEPRREVAAVAARVIGRLAAETEEGFGNFRFAALACVPPGAPFFPAAYHQGPTRMSIGLQGAGIVREALGHGEQLLDLPSITERIRDALLARAAPIVETAERLAREAGVHFGGVDLSPAPMGTDSIVAAIEAAAGEPLGSPGTLATVAAVTAGIRAVPLPTCGYNGLMLPVLEDAVLGERWREGRVDVRSLLFYSSVCGTGLDTVPVPGDSTDDQIAGTLLDVATLATRLNKPLSARLFPVPGTHAGDMTTFTSPYLTNTIVTW